MSFLVNVTPEQQAVLDKFGSTIHCSYSNDAHGNTSATVTLIDQLSGKAWHSCRGSSHHEALATAIATASSVLRPKSTSDIAAEAMTLADENAKLREMVEAYRAQQATTPKRKSQSTETT